MPYALPNARLAVFWMMGSDTRVMGHFRYPAYLRSYTTLAHKILSPNVGLLVKKRDTYILSVLHSYVRELNSATSDTRKMPIL